jgi:hypothetical protein
VNAASASSAGPDSLPAPVGPEPFGGLVVTVVVALDTFALRGY